MQDDGIGLLHHVLIFILLASELKEIKSTQGTCIIVLQYTNNNSSKSIAVSVEKFSYTSCFSYVTDTMVKSQIDFCAGRIEGKDSV